MIIWQHCTLAGRLRVEARVWALERRTVVTANVNSASQNILRCIGSVNIDWHLAVRRTSEPGRKEL
jgi:hypothetical protein